VAVAGSDRETSAAGFGYVALISWAVLIVVAGPQGAGTAAAGEPAGRSGVARTGLAVLHLGDPDAALEAGDTPVQYLPRHAR
jgi:hypothetical protein